mmetsp:Transcript_11052/g.38373  ORF Transcript_11052/g.38373 Transcript_11052/m.38373 type:complete len:230 (-) Transcript_11052:315-1004(-)
MRSSGTEQQAGSLVAASSQEMDLLPVRSSVFFIVKVGRHIDIDRVDVIQIEQAVYERLVCLCGLCVTFNFSVWHQPEPAVLAVNFYARLAHSRDNCVKVPRCCEHVCGTRFLLACDKVICPGFCCHHEEIIFICTGLDAHDSLAFEVEQHTTGFCHLAAGLFHRVAELTNSTIEVVSERLAYNANPAKAVCLICDLIQVTRRFIRCLFQVAVNKILWHAHRARLSKQCP